MSAVCWPVFCFLLVFFEGVSQKWGGKTWCFDGENMVRCVVNVVIKTPHLER
jgi:hypothetical protein